jgi:U3 small nucleolar RNA-associated protein 20
VAEAKEVSVFAGQYKETKRCRAYEAYQLLATHITFSTHMDPLLQLVLQRLPSGTAPAVRNKLALLLQAASRGVAVNPTAGSVDLAVWVERTLDRCLTVEEAARAAAKAAVGAAHEVKPVKGSGQGVDQDDQQQQDAVAAAAESPGAAHLYLVTEFTLSLLSAAVKRGVLAGRDPDTMSLLDPLVPHLIRALGCRHPGSVAVALRLLTTLVNLPLTSLATAAAAAGKAVTKLLQQVPDAGHPVAQDCFRLLAGLLRGCPEFQPSNAQIRFLVKWLTTDLTSDGTAATAAGAAVGAVGGGSSAAGGGERQAGLGLLRAILGRKILVPEVYDAMNQVQEVMIR